jgi:hypothetical protein
VFAIKPGLAKGREHALCVSEQGQVKCRKIVDKKDGRSKENSVANGVIMERGGNAVDKIR